MSHSVSETAARAVRNSERKTTVDTRTPAERLSAIRGSVAAKLFVTPDDVKFLLATLDAALATAATLDKEFQAAI